VIYVSLLSEIDLFWQRLAGYLTFVQPVVGRVWGLSRVLVVVPGSHLLSGFFRFVAWAGVV